MRSFFDDNARYTQTGANAENDIYKVLRPVVHEWISKGYSPREIALLCVTISMEIMYDAMLGGYEDSDE